MNRRPGQRPQPDEGQEGNRDLDQAAGGAGVAIGCQKGDPLLHAGGGGLGGAGLASLSHVIVSVGFVVDLQPASGTKMNIACSSEKNRRLVWQAAVLNLAKRPSRGRAALLDLEGAGNGRASGGEKGCR